MRSSSGVRGVTALLLCLVVVWPMAASATPATSGGSPPPETHAQVPRASAEVAGHAATSTDATHAESGGTEARSITVTPDVGLVDGQQVSVQGTGFGNRSLLGIVQCARGLGIGGCDNSSADLVLGVSGGAFTDSYRVDAILDTPAGEIDCRTFPAGCRITVNHDYTLAGAAQAVISFDPDAPLEPSPTVAIDPAIDLLDEQLVTVTASGLRPGEYVYLVECAPGAVDPESDCRNEEDAVADAAGEISVAYFVEARLDTTDCRLEACELLVVAADDRIGRVTLAFDPDAPLRPDLSLTVTPHRRLVHGQTITVEAGGYTPNGPVEIVACHFTIDFDRDECDLGEAVTLTTDADGSLHTTFTVSQTLDAAAGPIDCATSFCVLAVVDRSMPPVSFGHGYLMETLEFGRDDVEPPVDPTDPTNPADPTPIAPHFTG